MNKPVYKGQSLSVMTPLYGRQSEKEPLQEKAHLWTWFAFWSGEPAQESTLDIVSSLVEQGYQQTKAYIPIETQLYEVVRLADKEGSIQDVWYKPEGKTPHDVILAFAIDPQPEPNLIALLNPLPLPQLGEYGLVGNSKGELIAYHILDLPLVARQHWTALGEALRKLSSPLQWPAYTNRHKIASDENAYQRQLLSLQTQQNLAIGKTRQNLMIEGALLGAAHMHIEQLHKMLNKPDWVEQWQEVKRMARELADDYYYFQVQVEDTLTVASAEKVLTSIDKTQPSDTPDAITATPQPQLLFPDDPPIVKPEQKKPRAPRRPRITTGIVTKGKDAITVKSDIINREIINALRDPKAYETYQSEKVAEHRHTFQKEKGQIVITIRALENEGWGTVLNALNTLGDGCIDTYIATMAIALKHNGTQHVRMPFEISPDDILAFCGKKKSHGSYTPLQRAEVIKHLKTLSQARVIATMPGKPARRGSKSKKAEAGTYIKAEGALIDLLSFKIGEYHTITGEEIWSQRSISIGPWVTMIPEISMQTATMLRQVLAYSANNERYQKRLGVYLTFMFRINAARRGGIFECSMMALLEGAGIIPDRQYGRFRDAIEYALTALQKDNVIGEYIRIVESSTLQDEREKRIHEHARGWWEDYAAQIWQFFPPANIKQQYQKLLKEPAEGD